MWKRFVLPCFLSVLVLSISSPLMIGQASASSQLSDCSDRVKFRVNWASTFKNAVQAYDGTIINDKWQVFVGMDTVNPRMLLITGAAGQNQNFHSIKVTNYSNANQMYTQLDFKSTDQNLYRMYWSFDNNTAGSPGSVSKFTPADNYSRSLQLYCGFGNTHVEYLTLGSYYSVTAIAPVKQDVDLGFIDPQTTTTTTPSTEQTGGSVTENQLKQTLAIFQAYG